MSEELFSPAEVASQSPRLQWLVKHGLLLEAPFGGGTECPESGDMIPKWVCRVIEPKLSLWAPNEIGGGDTEDEACAQLAFNRGIKTWNEETP